jgi:excisionase family DNA binding protein
MSDTPRFLTVEEVAEILRVTPQCIRRRITLGQMKAVREGRKWLIEDSVVYSLITRR